MLAVPNRSDWEDYFRNAYLSNCDVKVYQENNNTLLLSKENIANFSFASRNCFVCENVPTVDCQIEVINWSSLSSSIRTYLTTFPSWVKIKFTVNNVETTGYHVLGVYNAKISRDGRTATLYLKSPLQFADWDYRLGRSNSIADDFGLIKRFTNSTVSSTRAESSPQYWTLAEAYQHFSLKENKGIKLNSRYFEWGNVTKKDFDPFSVEGNLWLQSVNDYDYDYDESNKDKMIIYGVVAETPTVLFTGTQSSSVLKSCDVLMDKPVVVTDYTRSPTSASWGTFTLEDNVDRCRFAWTGNVSGTKTFEVVGYEAKLASPVNNNLPYISTYAVIQGTQALTNLQNYCQYYFSFKQFVEIDCLIDPTLEPLDIIDFRASSTESQRITIEEVKIDFNGGFSGHVKARITEPYVNAPVVQNVQASIIEEREEVGSFSFDIVNNNSFDVEVEIGSSQPYPYHDGSYGSFTVPANSTRTITNTDFANISYNTFLEVKQYFDDYYVGGSLSDPLYCWFTKGGLESDNAYILEEY